MKSVPHTFKQIGFTGDYAQLKHMGFKFQKLFASNYMQWHHKKADISIWKKGADVQISRIMGMEGILLQMMLDNTVFHIRKGVTGYYLRMYINRLTNELSIDDTEYLAQIRGDADVPRVWEAFAMNQDSMFMLQKLAKLGWIHVKDIEGDYYIDDYLLAAA